MRIGQYNTLRAVRVEEDGIVLRDDSDGQEAWLPASEEPDGLELDDQIELFVYVDGTGQAVATRRRPLAQCGTFACLRVVEVTPVGAFLDWGLPKDLLVPFSEQPHRMERGLDYTVYVYLDEASGRPVASARLQRFLGPPPDDLRRGQEVELLIDTPSELGRNVIVDDRYRALLFHNDITRPVRQGERLTGFIKRIKEGGKIDVTLQRPGYAKVGPQAERILHLMEQHEGFLPLNDKSDPALIFDRLHMSKKTFKKAIGALYKQRRIRIASDGIYLS